MMDPPIVNEASFSAANLASYSLAGIWPFAAPGNAGDSGGGLGLRMGSLSRFAEVAANSIDESTVTEQSGGPSDGNGCSGGGRKRRNVKSVDESSIPSVATSGGANSSGLRGKRMKESESKDENSGSKAEAESSSRTVNRPAEQNSKPEPPKDYIHVRARRGQATDSHSLAERARREKISERMKILQDLVPGCNKVIGKALVLDEIINYIQSLQRQVEFLSMKLEAVNARISPTLEAFPPKAIAAPAYDTTGMLFSTQAAREYIQGAQQEWLHMQIGSSSFERAI